MLGEFFTLTKNGWQHAAADDEIERFSAKRQQAIDATNVRWKRNRALKSATAEGAAQAPPPEPPNDTDACASLDTGAVRSRKPITNTREELASASSCARPRESPDELFGRIEPLPSMPQPEAPQLSPAGLACKAMRQQGLSRVNPADPRLYVLLRSGATVDELASVAAEAVARGAGWAWALKVASERRKEAARYADLPHAPPPLSRRAQDAADEVARWSPRIAAGRGGTA